VGGVDAEEGRRRERDGGNQGGGLTWLDCWAIARYDLALSDEEWLAMTPRQLFALKRRKLFDMQCAELMMSRLTAAVCNSGFMRPKEPVEDTRFMLHPFPKPPEPPGDAIIRMLEGLPLGAAIRVN
jgi:hypothetical protein